jgi:isopropylmalate/homocitrate/citramalate synthase
MLPTQVRLVEVGPRDGLQNEKTPLSVQTKVQLIRDLAAAGLSVIEAGSFVSAQSIPQMANTAEVVKALGEDKKHRYPVLVPNQRGLDDALAAGCRDIAVFASASETFSQKNIHCSIAESLARYKEVITKAQAADCRIRGYVSCVLGCPYEGEIALSAVTSVAQQLYDLGCEEISLGDTIGVGTPEKAKTMLSAVAEKIPMERLAVHFHDTYGQALANIYACLTLGVSIIDSSVGGLGGCPYAPGAAGNVATEDVVFMLNGLNIAHGVDLEALLQISQAIFKELKHLPRSKVAQAMQIVSSGE